MAEKHTHTHAYADWYKGICFIRNAFQSHFIKYDFRNWINKTKRESITLYVFIVAKKLSEHKIIMDQLEIDIENMS